MSTALVFDIDNTLTPPRQTLEREMAEALVNLSVPFALAAGSDLGIVQGQFFDPLARFGYRGGFDAFLCNGATLYRCECDGGAKVDLVREFRFRDHLGAAAFPRLLGILESILEDSQYRLPDHVPVVGDRIIDRGSMVNFAPAGRPRGANLSSEARASRDAFVAYDGESGYRSKLLAHLKERFAEFADVDLVVTLGGQTSFDIVVKGSDKSAAVKHLIDAGVGEVVYFGDALFDGGNDGTVLDFIAEYEPQPCPARAVQVDGWRDTLGQLKKLGFLRG
jgi:hydroxymethylpyrimidine pyrophosphatase-like HAD family hydrolase